MENEQISKKLDWLDGQREKDSESLQRLKAQINNNNGAIESIAKQMEDLSAEVSRLAAVASKVNQFDETIIKHRTEISRQLEDAENRRTKKEKQLESLRASDQKNLARSIDELRRELEKIEIIDEELIQQRTEESRLNKELGELSGVVQAIETNLSDRTLRLVSLEEASTQELKRTNEMQIETDALNRKTVDLRNNIELIEDRARKIDLNLADLKSSDSERSDQLNVWMDEQRMKLVDFEKKWSDWEKRFKAFESEAKMTEEKINTYQQTHRSIKQLQTQLEGLLERLERRITEVGEMQRLSDERMKQDWTAFEADETKKWSTFKLSSEERWREHHRIHDKLHGRLDELEVLRTEIRQELDMLLEREARKVSELVELTRQWLKAQD